MKPKFKMPTIVRQIGTLKKLLEGNQDITETVKTMLPYLVELNVKHAVGLAGQLPKKAVFEAKITTVMSDGKEWLALLFRETE